MGGTRTLNSTEMLQTTKLFAIFDKSVLGNTFRCDVDLVQGTDPFHFGIWMHSFLLDGCYAHVEAGEDSVSLFKDISWIDTVQSYSDGRVSLLRLRFSMLNHKHLILAFSTGDGYLLRRLLEVLSVLNSTKMVRELCMIEDYDLEPVIIRAQCLPWFWCTKFWWSGFQILS
jgi:hypothetical protein